MIGGDGNIIEIDESKFGKWKYHKSHCIKEQWLFGGIERNSRRIFLVPVERRDMDTLTAVIKEWIRPRIIIISDSWKAYDILEKGFKHLKVNHNVNFIDPSTGAHTISIESTWRHTKYFLSEYCRLVFITKTI